MGEIEVVEYKKKFKKDWDEFLKRVGFGEITFTTDFLEIIESEYGYKPLHRIAYKNGEVVGIFPAFLVKGLFGGRKIVSLPFSERGGIVCVESEKQIIKEFIDSINEIDVQYIEIRAPLNTKTLTGFGFIKNTNYNYCTFLIDLTRPIDEIWKRISKSSIRRYISKLKENIHIVEVDDIDGVVEFYNLYLATLKFHGSPPHSISFFKKLWRVFYPNNVRITLAQTEDKNIGGILCFKFGNKIHYSFGATRSEYPDVSKLLLWDAIEYGAKNSFKTFDFGRTRKNSGVYNFKSRWGGKEQDLPYYIKLVKSTRMPYIDPNNTKYKLLTRMWSHLPVTIIKHLGPKIRGFFE